MEEFTAIGLIVVVLGMIAKGFIDWFKQRNLQNSELRLKSLEDSIITLSKELKAHDENHGVADTQIKELHEWHNRRDPDGVPVWYVRKSLEDIIKQNADAVLMLAQQGTMQTKVLKELSENQKNVLDEIRRLQVAPTLAITHQ